MSSHREAPEISKDPVVDNTDVYAFVSPDKPDTVTLIANFIPFQDPQGGPNFYEFGTDVLYEINISNRGTSEADVVFRFRFDTAIRNNNTFLYNTGPITSLSSPSWNRPQTYSVVRYDRAGGWKPLAKNLPCPPVNVGPRSTPNYAALAQDAIKSIKGGRKVFAGQRADGFFVDTGSIFDLGVLRPFQNLHLIPTPSQEGKNGLAFLNVHSIAIQVPISDLTKGGVTPTAFDDPNSTIGVWATASRQRTRVFDNETGKTISTGAFKQVSRLGMPLFNEVITPMAEKDRWNAKEPQYDKQYANYVAKPELAGLLPVLYPGVFPNLAGYDKDRADLLAILLTGIPKGIIDGFQNYTGPVQADMLRLNVAIPPTTRNPSPNGILGGDLAGFPNGRRVTDDVTAIELKAVAGATIPLVDPSFTPDGAASLLEDGTVDTPRPPTLNVFPYLGVPTGGYQAMTSPPEATKN